ncbi:probable glutathione S-transferase [Eucalyptus grandis]|uniref:probable glutathione S-transferase n=1 Tax=Eucalyptus grandis TaxID=71139 RepID=UPI00192E8173|nr:probable glutathione S-transferase [Eucalyptus grandis]
MARFWAKFGDDNANKKQLLQRQVSTCRSWKNNLKGRNSLVDATSDIWTLRLDGWSLHFGVFEEISSLKVVDGERFPPLFAWLKEFSDAPIIKDRWPPHDKLNLKFIALRQVHLTKSSSA